MKTYRNLYPQIWDFENLYLAYRKARKGKRGKEPAAAFEQVQEEELLALQDELRAKTYTPGPYHSFYIHEPKHRLISAAPFRDRVDRLVLEVTPIQAQSAEEPKALIAGYHGRTRAEYLDWGLALAEKALLSRPERRKVLLVLHDGEPVYTGDLGNDYQMSLARLRRLERQGITPIGLYLGEGANIAQLEVLFPRLVITSGEQLPEKLGGMLMSLT